MLLCAVCIYRYFEVYLYAYVCTYMHTHVQSCTNTSNSATFVHVRLAPRNMLCTE